MRTRWSLPILAFASGVLIATGAPAAELDNLPEQAADLDLPHRADTRPPHYLAGILGVAVVNTAQYVGSDDRVTFPLPLVYFNYNDRLFWSIAAVGGWLYRSDDRRLRVGLLAKARGGISGSRAPYDGIADRDPSVDAGLNVAWRVDPLVLGFSWLGDALGHSHGQTASARLSWPIPLSPKWGMTPSLIAEWQDDRLVDYYYGVPLDETGGGAPFYVGRSTTSLRLGWSLNYRVTRRWGLTGGISYSRLGVGIADSPLVSRSDNFLVFAAARWTFLVRD